MPKDLICSPRTHTQTDRQTHRVTTVGTLSGFHDFFLQPIIKDRPNSVYMHNALCTHSTLVVLYFYTLGTHYQVLSFPEIRTSR